MRKFYRKTVVRTPIYLSNGARVSFSDVGNDIGVFETSDIGLQNEFEVCVRMQRGGVEEIDEATFAALLETKKKSTRPAPPLSRFDQRASAHIPAGAATSAEAVAAKPPATVPKAPDAPAMPPLAKVEPLVVPEFTPRTGRRTKTLP